ncbi:hypothetical protein PR048_004937 [Dryococelus australis]|uniref:Uncharacterized protein n=1 Tax=Dryococelus australis TaxID=614101 RepID=A0ABQ9I7A0_9NEOP|nr:hypothetical protein PR048_004937 [Dryococelus australis]
MQPLPPPADEPSTSPDPVDKVQGDIQLLPLPAAAAKKQMSPAEMQPLMAVLNCLIEIEQRCPTP